MESTNDTGAQPGFPENLLDQVKLKIVFNDDGQCEEMKIRTGRQIILPHKNRQALEEACTLLGWQLKKFSRDASWQKKELPKDAKPLRKKGEYVLHLKRIPL